MRNIRLNNPFAGEMTAVSNIFIDCYMPHASGEYVKLYLFLLRQTCEHTSVSLEVIADLFDTTEKAILQGLAYWQERDLLRLSYDSSGNVDGLSFSEPKRPEGSLQAAAAYMPPKKEFSYGRISHLKEDADVKRILFIAESYLGKTLSATEITSLLYYYDSLHFDADLIEYLIEYCISRGSRSFHYIDKVALSWAESGVRTVEDAKETTSLYGKKYYSILNAFGIKGRGPAKTEAEMIDYWFDKLHFTKDIILEACNRTVAQTQHPSFQYANKILETWSKNGIRHLSDIKALDQKRQKKTSVTPGQPAVSRESGNRFNNFPQRDIDFERLESQLLNQ